MKIAEKRAEERLKEVDELVANANEMAEKLKGTVLTFKKKARGEKLYGSISEKDMIEALKKDHKVEIGKDMVKLKEPLKTLGEHKVILHLAEGVEIKIGIIIEAE